MAQSANMDASELARDIAAGLASATTATERAALVPAELVEAIHQLKTQRDAVILAHYYVAPEVQAVADYVGDSFYLAKLAKSLPQQTIVLCGVEFMGESAKLLNPTKTVLLPEPGADCPMAHMVKRETVDAARATAVALARYTGGAVVVSGEVDLITDGATVAKSHGGSPLMSKITGCGCSQGGVLAVYACAADPFTAAICGTAVYNVAGTRAAAVADAPASFKVAFIDELYRASAQDIASNQLDLEEA